MSKNEAVRPASIAATILCAGLLGTWFWIKIHQGFALEVTAGTQTFRIAAAALLLAPALALIYLSAKPEMARTEPSSRGSLSFAVLGFVWLPCALILSLFVGFAPV